MTPSLPITVTTHGVAGQQRRVRATFSISYRENFISAALARELGLMELGRTRLTRNGTIRPFCYVDIIATAGLLGLPAEHHAFRGVMVIPSRNVRGLVIGLDLVSRGQLVVGLYGLTFAF